MFDSVALNVVISLVFIYLLYSLLVTTINEGIASFFNLRAKTLEKAIMRMLTNDGKKDNDIVDNFYQQPIIKFLGEDNTKKPAYMTSTTFAKALIYLCQDLAKDGATYENKVLEGIQKIKIESPETGKYLETIFQEADGNIEIFQKSAERWFDETMHRATGWYKRKAQFSILAIAFVIALSFNVDSIGIAKNLSSNPKLAQSIANTADIYLKNHPETLSKAQNDSLNKEINFYLKKAHEQIDSEIKNTNSVLALGWEEKNWNDNLLQKIVGIIITTLAISLGAPFWFDLLNKLIQLRGSKKPDGASEQSNYQSSASIKKVA